MLACVSGVRKGRGGELGRETTRERGAFLSRLKLPFLDYESSPFFLRDRRVSETLVRVKITPREKRQHAWGDFHARSRFVRSTIPEEKWGLLVVYPFPSLSNACHAG